jgi:uncharacterized protein YcnI
VKTKTGGNFMRNKKWMAPIIALLLIFLIAPIAEAHVTVRPGESSTNAWEKYSVRVPVEKDINTTKIELKVPNGINLVSVMPVDNWDYKFEKDENDITTSVTWTAKNDGIKPNEFIEFYFIASNPSEPGEFSWEAFQTYEDGSVVEWTGAPGTDEPASVTKVVAVGAEAGATENAQEQSSESNNTSGSGSWLPITLSSVALLLALISLFRKKA